MTPTELPPLAPNCPLVDYAKDESERSIFQLDEEIFLSIENFSAWTGEARIAFACVQATFWSLESIRLLSETNEYNSIASATAACEAWEKIVKELAE